MIDATKLRSWLLPNPRPTMVRVKSGRETHEIEIAGQSWAAVAKSIVALDPERIDAIDANGKVIRVLRPQDEEDDEPEATAEPAPAAVGPSHAYEPGDVRLEQFARLLAEAYKHSTSIAFANLVAIVEAQNKRAESLERSMQAAEKLLRRQIEEQAEELAIAREEVEEAAKNGPLGGLGEIAQQFIGGMKAGGEAAAPAKPNGKGH